MFTSAKHDEDIEGRFLEAGAVVEDRRSVVRVCCKVSVRLTAVGCCEGLACLVEDLSEDGLYVQVPAKYGMAVGKRVEVVFADEADSPAPAGLAGEICYATVIRTATLADDARHMVGAGLRFDQPLYF